MTSAIVKYIVDPAFVLAVVSTFTWAVVKFTQIDANAASIAVVKAEVSQTKDDQGKLETKLSNMDGKLDTILLFVKPKEGK